MIIKKKKIFVVGRVKGANRCEDLIRNLSSLESDQYEVMYFHRNTPNKVNFLKKIVMKFYEKIFNMFYVIKSDIVFYLAMNNHNLVELQIASKLGKRVIVDIYTLREDVVSENRQYGTTPQSSIRSKKFRKIDQKKIKNATDIIYVTAPEKKYIESKHINAKAKNAHIISASQNKLIFSRKSRRLDIDYYNDNLMRGDRPLVLSWWGQASYMHNFNYIFKEISAIDQKKLILNIFDPSKKRIVSLKWEERLLLESIHSVHFDNDLTFNNGLASRLLRFTDASIGMFGNTLLAKNVAPNKVLESALLGIPCLTRSSPAYKELKPFKEIVQIEPKPNKLKNHIIKLIEQKQEKKLPKRSLIQHLNSQDYGYSQTSLLSIFNH